MSYAFRVEAATRKAAKIEVELQLAKVVAQQEVHIKDVAQAIVAAHAMIYLLDEPEENTQLVVVNVSGSLNWTGSWPSIKVTNANISVNAYLVAKKVIKQQYENSDAE